MFKQKFIALVAVLVLIAPGAEAAKKAPQFKLPTIKSKISLSAYKGKLVYVDFWASWCDPCRKSFPWMSDLQKRYRSNLKIIAVNLDQDRGKAIKFLKKLNPKFTVAFDPKGKVAEAYSVGTMPTSYLIDRSGRIVAKYDGFRSSEKQKVEQKILSLLSKKHAKK